MSNKRLTHKEFIQLSNKQPQVIQLKNGQRAKEDIQMTNKFMCQLILLRESFHNICLYEIITCTV